MSGSDVQPCFSIDQEIAIQRQDGIQTWISEIRTMHASAGDIGVSPYFWSNLRNVSTCSSIREAASHPPSDP
jgi:hypothetical protein